MFARIVLMMLAGFAVSCRSARVDPASIPVVPATSSHADAIHMSCVERGVVSSRGCSCEQPAFARLTRDEALATLRAAAAKIGANIVWVRSEWKEEWGAVHCPDTCGVSQHRIVGVAYACPAEMAEGFASLPATPPN